MLSETKSPAELLGLYERLCEATDSTPDLGDILFDAKGQPHWRLSDKATTDILEARIWRVLREWADKQYQEFYVTMTWDYDQFECSLATDSHHRPFFEALEYSLVDLAEAVIEHIRKGEA